jgi:hypothetical protein
MKSLSVLATHIASRQLERAPDLEFSLGTSPEFRRQSLDNLALGGKSIKRPSKHSHLPFLYGVVRYPYSHVAKCHTKMLCFTISGYLLAKQGDK